MVFVWMCDVPCLTSVFIGICVCCKHQSGWNEKKDRREKSIYMLNTVKTASAQMQKSCRIHPVSIFSLRRTVVYERYDAIGRSGAAVRQWSWWCVGCVGWNEWEEVPLTTTCRLTGTSDLWPAHQCIIRMPTVTSPMHGNLPPLPQTFSHSPTARGEASAFKNRSDACRQF